ncbi:MAG: hypothetical protein EOO09_14810 [Chitinophagaceae bacterium]|nr:MAG: hypothetical protein EOO09_14810 [Chitinophagaceae bacterium]
MASDYVYYTPYQFAGNEVPNAIDLDGLEPARPVQSYLAEGFSEIAKTPFRLLDRLSFSSSVTYKEEQELGQTSAGNLNSFKAYSANVTMDFSITEWMGSLSRTNSDDGLASPINFGGGVQVATGLTLESGAGPITFQNTTSLDTKNGFVSEQTATLSTSKGAIPLDYSISSTSGGGSSSKKFEIKANLFDKISIPVGIGVTKDSKGTTIDLSGGIELKAKVGPTTYSVSGSAQISSKL